MQDETMPTHSSPSILLDRESNAARLRWVDGFDGQDAPPPAAPDAVICPYCEKPDPAWMPDALRAGKRWLGCTLEYHCYAGYCWD